MGCDNVRRYLSSIVEMMRPHRSGQWPYVNIDDFVLRNGRAFKPGRRLWKGMEWGEEKQCFANATHAMLRFPKLTYCEGYALGIIPVLHAWLVTPRGIVVDPTWRKAGTEYFGVPFNKQFVMRTLRSRGYYGVLDNMEEGFPLLTGKATDFGVDLKFTAA